MPRVKRSQVQSKPAETTPAEDPLFEVPDYQGGGEPPAPSFPRPPDLRRGFQAIAEDLFDHGYDVAAEYRAIEQALIVRGALTPGALQVAANNTEEMARRAYRLYVVGKVELEAYVRETEKIVGAIRESAIAKLEEQKAKGLLTKRITEADADAACAQYHGDEWEDIHQRRDRAQQMVKYLEQLADLSRSRCHTVARMLNPGGRL